MSIMSKLTASYLAGFIDGEGYLGLHPAIRGKNGRTSYSAELKIASTDQFIIVWMQKSFGGIIYEKKPNNPKHKDSLNWTLQGKNLKPFLQKIHPYLRLKKKQCELLLRKIKLQESVMRNIPNPNISRINKQRENKRLINLAYRDSQRKEIENIYLQLRKLNKRGK